MISLIRNNINYGELVVVSVEGIELYVDIFNVTNKTKMDFEERPYDLMDFYSEFHLETDVGIFYIPLGTDAKKALLALSKHVEGDVKIYCSARWLMVANKGVLKGNVKPLRSFYCEDENISYLKEILPSYLY